MCEAGFGAASCRSIAAPRPAGDSSVSGSATASPEPLQPLGAHRLLGLAARGEGHQDRAAAGLQHVADGIVAGLRNGEFALRRAATGKSLRKRKMSRPAGALAQRRVEIGLRQVGAGDQAPAAGRPASRAAAATAASTSSLPAAPPPAETTTSYRSGDGVGARRRHHAGIGDLRGDRRGERKRVAERREGRIAMHHHQVEMAVEDLDRLLVAAGLDPLLQDVAHRGDQRRLGLSWRRSRRAAAAARTASAAGRTDRPRSPRCPA